MKRSAFSFAVLAVALLIASTLLCSAATVCVKWDSPGPTFDGASWDTAFHTVQASLDAATSGDEVWVASGTYVERITLKTGVGLYGGFAGTETSRDARDWNANITILDGSQGGTVVTSPSGATASTVIDGFTIRNSSQSAILVSSASPTIANNMIVGNASTGTITNPGGAVCLRNSSSLVTNNIITGNTGYSGGGVYCSHSSAVIANNVITRNSSSNGGGIYVADCTSSTVIAGNLIAGNSTSHVGGGGIFCTTCTPTVTGNTIAGNSGPDGGGIFCNTATPSLANNIIAFNSSGVSRPSGTGTTVGNNCVFGNTSYAYRGVSAGPGDIFVDPKLASREFGSYHIQPDSPCVNAGSNGAPGIQGSDIDGQPRILDGTVDIGADESDGTTWPSGPYAVIRVSPTGNDSSDGSSWDLAKRTVQAGVDAASVLGGEVWVQAGVYAEQITLSPYCHLYGGFAGIESERSQRNQTANPTILDGMATGRVITANLGHEISTVDGFVIRNGLNSGILCRNSGPTVTNNVITGNSGGGIYCVDSTSLVAGNMISANTSSRGGGMYCQNSRTRITGNVIVGNGATNQGGGIYARSYPVTITNNTIVANSARYAGGFYSYMSDAQVTNNIISFNSSGIQREQAGLILQSNCVFGNTAYDYYSSLQPGAGDISADPLFADPAGGNYRLRWYSPCIDMGTNVGAPPFDMDGHIRPVDGNADGLAIADMGAYEYQPIPVTIDVLPGDPSNRINLQPNRVITVAVISDGRLDLRAIDQATIGFGPAAAGIVHKSGHWEDANGDGVVDLVLHFRCGDTEIMPGDSTVCLCGRLIGGEPFIGCAAVTAISK